jgi:hypothetical protein
MEWSRLTLSEGPMDQLESVFKELSSDEQEILLAAFAAMVDDNHSVHDNLTSKQWEIAAKFYVFLIAEMDSNPKESY